MGCSMFVVGFWEWDFVLACVGEAMGVVMWWKIKRGPGVV